MKLVIGLGNPGKKYEKTRHNVGFLVVDALLKKLENAGVSKWESSKKFKAEIAGGTFENEKIIFAKPQTYMNDSGEAVQLLANFYKVSSHDVIVVHDEKDIPLGEIKVQKDRGSAGHNGIKSITESLGTQDYYRIRVGVANEKMKYQDTADFVLSKFGLFEKSKLKEIILKAEEEIMKLV